MKKKLSNEKVHELRRSWDIPPPPMPEDNKFESNFSPLNSSIPIGMVPFTESTFLHQSLKNSTLLISFLYEHKEISTNRGIFFKIKEFLKLIKFNADYIKYNL